MTSLNICFFPENALGQVDSGTHQDQDPLAPLNKFPSTINSAQRSRER